MSNWGSSSFRVLALLAVLGGATLWLGPIAWFATHPNSTENPKTLLIRVNKGESPLRIAKNLESEGIISSARKLMLIGKWLRKWNSIKVGEYQVSSSQTPLQILSVLGSGLSVSYPVTIQEGFNMYQVAALMEAKGLTTKQQFLSICKNLNFINKFGFGDPVPPSLEGYLFPETYQFTHVMSAEEMIAAMVENSRKVWTPKMEARAKELQLTRHQVFTLASIIEKETGAPEERPMISSVFHNRLKKRMRLQSDPTTIYGVWETYTGNIHRSHLHEMNPYNTYMIHGLPIGPVSNPGKEALQAALYPAESEYLFFVSKNDGTHEFTSSYGAHTSAVKKFQVDPKARAGKSWRDRSNKH